MVITSMKVFISKKWKEFAMVIIFGTVGIYAKHIRQKIMEK